MPLSEIETVRPFNPARFYGSIAYDGDTEGDAKIKVAAIAAHPSGEVAFLNLVGHDTAISSRTATLFLGEKKITYVPPADADWGGPRLLGRLFVGYKTYTKRLPGIRNTANTMVESHLMRIAFNRENPPDIPEELVKKKPEGQTGGVQVLTVKSERAITHRYVAATLDDGTEPAPSYGAVIGTLVGMRAVTLRPRQPETKIVARQWADALWQRGLAQGLVLRLPSFGVAVWAMRNSLLHWNMLISEGVSGGWLTTPRRGTPPLSVAGPQGLAIAAD